MNGSYLDTPRINFRGKFRADVNSRNNDLCNFDLNNEVGEVMEWNYRGTNEWELTDAQVTAVVGADGNVIPDSPLLGASIFTNKKRPFGKIVDIDVDFQVSSIYGMHFGMESGNEDLFQGTWSHSVIVHDMWKRTKCASGGSINFGAQSTTRITDIVWSSSALIESLKDATNCPKCTGELSVSISISRYGEDRFTFGEVTGTIGVAKMGEPLVVGGQRKMESADPGTLNFPADHPFHDCNQSSQKPWTYGAPFMVDKARKTLVVDFSNALPIYSVKVEDSLVDLGTLWFGVLSSDESSVILFGEPIPYLQNDFLIQSGIVEQTLTDDILSELENSKLVVAIESSGVVQDAPLYNVKHLLPSLNNMEQAQLILIETEYFVRPRDYYMDRLEFNSDSANPMKKDSSDMTLLVTRFGEPSDGTEVSVCPTYNQQQMVIRPLNVISVDNEKKTTGSDGLVSFNFILSESVPFPRIYTMNPCNSVSSNSDGDAMKFAVRFNMKEAEKEKSDAQYTLPIDGQLYNFWYAVGPHCKSPDDGKLFLYKAVLSFLAFSTVEYTAPYTWVDDVKPIFDQVHHLHYIMRTILDLSNFTEVTLPHNIELLKHAFSRDITDPNYMPVTRDLSPTKLQMIMIWLNNPLYSKQSNKKSVPATPICQVPPSPTLFSTNVPIPSYYNPPRCLLKLIPFDVDPLEQEPYFQAILEDPKYKTFTLAAENPPRPLFGLDSDQEKSDIAQHLETLPFFPVCSLDGLKRQLQLAVELEFATLPLYLTSLYSIIEDCNVDAYSTMRNIVMQEMLHFAQSANILIAIGGQVKIDDPTVVPNYPTTGLPGNVLPQLQLSLKKFDLEHTYHAFMGLESPMITFVGRPKPEITLNTIGQFYNEIRLCLAILGNEIYDPEREKLQVHWPWDSSAIGQLYNITDTASAIAAVKEIVEQGEGESPINPESGTNGRYGHFYRFEEIVCQNRLVSTQDGYSYSGAPIPYNSLGVWPMRDNPRKKTVIPGTQCETEARAFHHAYRAFLRVLDETFNGAPEKISDVVELMESLQVHAKKTMWTPYFECGEYQSDETCGPVWDYEWN